nr:hypothetical protein [Kibdelosporangium sp. MJ126-NF4]
MRIARLAALPLAVSAVIGLAACSNGGSAPGAGLSGVNVPKAGGAGKVPDLCSALPGDLVKKLIGDGAEKTEDVPGTCAYNVESTGFSVTVSAELDPSPEQWEIGRKASEKSGKKVDGIGDTAYVDSMNVLYARKGDVNIDVQIVNGDTDPAANLEEEKKILKDVISRNNL